MKKNEELMFKLYKVNASRIRQRLRTFDMGAEEFVRRCPVSKSAARHALRGGKVQLRTLKKLAKYFCVDVHELIEEDDHE